jgi:hypothetical protein
MHRPRSRSNSIANPPAVSGSSARWIAWCRGQTWWPRSSLATPRPRARGVPRSMSSVCCRLHCLQQWFNLSDPAVEEALYDSRAMRQFVGIDLGREPIPDEATICKFRHRLEAYQLGNNSLHGSGNIWANTASRSALG